MKKLNTVLLISILILSLSSCSSNPGTYSSSENPADKTDTGSSVQSKVDNASKDDNTSKAYNTSDSNEAKEAGKDSQALASSKENTIELEGTINNTLKIHMSLFINDGQVEGTYYYDKYKSNIRLEGIIDAGRMITLKEYSEEGAVTGTFDGWYVPGIRIEGTWINEKN